MSDSNLPVVHALGADYVAVDGDYEGSCADCVAANNAMLCRALPECSGRTFSIIFKEIS
jgi:hypothetical protein